MVIFVESLVDASFPAVEYMTSICTYFFAPRSSEEGITFRDIIWDDIPNSYRFYVSPAIKKQVSPTIH